MASKVNLKRVILHIGRHKSGTSSIQHCLNRNVDLLSAAGILYPKHGRGGRVAHHDIAKALNPKLQQLQINPTQIAEKILVERQKEEHTIIISSEAFQNICDLVNVKEFLKALGPENITIICYFREHLDYAIAAYRQFIHAQTIYQPFRAYLSGKFESQKNLIDNWKNHGDIKLKWFDHQSLENNDVVVDFLKAANLNIKLPSLRVNPSIGGDLLFLKLLHNYQGNELLDYNQLSSISTIAPEWSSPFQVDDCTASEIRSRSEYNSSVAEAIGREPYLKSFAEYELPPSRDIDHQLLSYLEANHNFLLDKQLKQQILSGAFNNLMDCQALSIT